MKKSYDKSTLVGRTIIAFECNSLRQLSKIFNIFPQDISNRIRRKTFLPLIEEEASKRNININWIITGRGEMMLKDGVSEQMVASGNNIDFDDLTPDTLQIVNKVINILELKNMYSKILKDAISGIYLAAINQDDLDKARIRIENLEKEILNIKRRLPAVGE